MTGPGKLTIVGTPIGNLDDFPPRGVQALKTADVILCEDTRHTRKLLNHFGIDKRAESFHLFNEEAKTAAIVNRIEAGETVALVSDAGMPIVSDPGFPLVREARARKVDIEVIPGPFAGILALAASGIAPLPFTFFGFTPHRAGERREFYRRIADVGHTAIVYESPERLLESLDDALSILGNTEATVAREMTKIHEEYISGSVSEVIEILRGRAAAVRGEITIVFGAARHDQSQVSPEDVKAEFERLRAEGMRRNDAVKTVAEKFGMRKNDVYRMLL